MGWFQRYLDLFDGEPVWLLIVASVVICAGLIVIMEKVLKLGVWLLIVVLVAALVMLIGGWFLF